MFNPEAMTESEWLDREYPGQLMKTAVTLGWVSETAVPSGILEAARSEAVPMPREDRSPGE